jgi:hypothetical protein
MNSLVQLVPGLRKYKYNVGVEGQVANSPERDRYGHDNSSRTLYYHHGDTERTNEFQTISPQQLWRILNGCKQCRTDAQEDRPR